VGAREVNAMTPERCPTCQYGPLKPGARACFRCGAVFRKLEGTLAEQYAGAGTAGPAGSVVVEAACTQCKRAVRVKEEDALRRVATGKGACQYCRGQVGWPPGLVERAATWTDPLVRVVLDGPCVCCGRAAKTRPGYSGGQMGCAYCGMTFVVDTARRVTLPPPEPAVMATEAEVAGWWGRVPDRWPYPFLARVFLQRARAGELAQGEAQGLFSAMTALEGWTARQDWPQLPLPLAEAQDVVRHVLFRAAPSTVDGTEVVFNFPLGSVEGWAPLAVGLDAASSRRVTNAVGLGLLVLAGEGFVAVPGRGGEVATEHVVGRVRVAFREMAGGVEMSLGRQRNEEPRVPFTAAEAMAVAKAVGARRGQMLGYYALVALFGPRARGNPALQASLPCIQARLSSLGVPDADTQAAKLRFVHAPHPLNF
jgi:hypothetical protein